MSSGVRWDESQLKAYQARRGLDRHGKPIDERQGRLTVAEERIRIRQAAPASKLERRFEQQLLERPLIPPHQRNYFFLPDRDFELDFAWAPIKVYVEIQGMAHRIKGRFRADIEKRVLLTLAGWRGLELDGDAVRSGRGIEWLVELLGKA